MVVAASHADRSFVFMIVYIFPQMIVVTFLIMELKIHKFIVPRDKTLKSCDPPGHRPMGICSTLLPSCILHIPVWQLMTYYRYVHHQTYHMMLPIILSKITLSLYWSLSHFIKIQFRISSNCDGSHNGRTGAVITQGKLTFYYPSMEGKVYNKSNELLE